MKRKRSATLEERVTTLETELPHIYRELKEIKKQITNDIPHQIAALEDSVEKIGRRYGDLDAVSRFLSVCVKGVALLLGVLWSWRQLFGGK
jgi:hypothetical protein